MHGRELWTSDSTPGGTAMVKDVNPAESSYASALTDVNGTLYFVANDGVHGYELWEVKRDEPAPFPVPVPGLGAGGSTPPPDTTAPVLSDASLSTRIFAINPRGGARAAAAVRRGALRYRLSEAGRVHVTVKRAVAGRRIGGRCVKPTRSNRGTRRCTRLRSSGRFAIDSHAGTNSHEFPGRIGPKSLAAGRYRASLVATDAAGNRSASAGLDFRVVAARTVKR